MEARRFGQYRVTGILGEGGMGVVYAAEHTLLARPAAVKVLLPELSGNQEIVKRFFNEARAATAIRHPGIVEVYEVGRIDDGSAYIVMEHLEGETLRARRRRAPMRWSTALAIVRQIAGALGAAHAKGIVHRDLKPANIFLVPDPEVPGGERIKLLDFGIAKLAGSLSGQHMTRTGTVIGTPTYMAPEQCRGVAVDSRADLYALGCILFELCTGQPPFVCEGEGDILVAHIREQPPTIASLTSGVPQEIEAIVQRLLAKSPLDRVQTADELIRLIDAAKATIHQIASADTRPRLASEITFPDATTRADHDEPGGESVSTQQERWSTRRSRRDAVVPALVTSVLEEAPVLTEPAMPVVPRRDTTLSSAAGTSPRAVSGASPRRSAMLGVAGGLAILGAIALTLVLFNRGGDDAESGLGASSSSPAEAVPPPLSPPTVTVSSAERVEDPPATIPVAPPDGVASLTVKEPAAPPPSEDPSPPETTPSDVLAAPEPRVGAQSQTTPQPRSAKVRLAVDSTPSGATVILDGKPLGQTPWIGKVKRRNDEVRLVLRLDGYKTRGQPIRLDDASSHSLVLEKLPTPPAPAQQPAQSAPASAPSAAAPSSPKPAPPPQPAPSSPQPATGPAPSSAAPSAGFVGDNPFK